MERKHGASVDVRPDARALRIDHIASPSFDPAATHRFYTRVISGRLVIAVSGTTESGQRWLVVEYAVGDTQLAFLTYEGMHAPSGGDLPDDIRHVAFNVGDLDELWRWRAVFEAAEVPYRIEFHGEADPHVYVHDPNGLVLEFAIPCERTAEMATGASAVLSTWVPSASDLR